MNRINKLENNQNKGVIYIFRANNLFKIGKTTDMYKRKKHIIQQMRMISSFVIFKKLMTLIRSNNVLNYSLK